MQMASVGALMKNYIHPLIATVLTQFAYFLIAMDLIKNDFVFLQEKIMWN